MLLLMRAPALLARRGLSNHELALLGAGLHFLRRQRQLQHSHLLGRASNAKFSTSSSSNAVKVKKRQQLLGNVMDDERENIAWWYERLKSCKKPATLAMMKRLSFTNLLGLDTNLRSGSLKENTLNFALLEAKRKFPKEVLLCRVGEFYEACGFDACILVEYAGLNPMGGIRAETVPKAGCPLMNLRQTLDDLTGMGFSVCIMEEVQAPGQVKQRKDRFVSGHAHPGSPYIYGLAGADTDIDFPEPFPVVGIFQSIRGYGFVSVLEMMRTYSIEDELTEEAVVTKLRSTQYQHLFLHRSLRTSLADTVRWDPFGEGGLLWGECNGKLMEWYDQDPLQQLLAKVKELYDIDDTEQFREIVKPVLGRPRPLYLMTACQIGVLPTLGIPSLLKVIVPADCTGLSLRYLRDLLLSPPPYSVAICIQEALKLMATVRCSVPEFVCVPAAKIAKLMAAREVNHIEFSRMLVLAEDMLYMFNSDDLKSIFHFLLEPTSLATGLKFDPTLLITDCKSLIDKVSDILSSHSDYGQETTSTPADVPSEFFYDMEIGWKGRVQLKHVEKVYQEVGEKAAQLIAAIEEDFVPVLRRAKSLLPTLYNSGSRKCEICYSRENQAIWFKGKGFQPVLWGGDELSEEQIKRLKPALDSKGKKVGEEWHTTVRVEEALESYRDAVSKANFEVVQVLRNLADDLKQQLNSIVFMSVFCVIAKALFAHVSECKRRQWTIPQLVAEQDSNYKLVLDNLVPYWLDPAQDFAVSNSIDMSSMFLLTGPNGGGKSSLLRSVCAASLLGNCGLMVPAKKAVIPMYDAIMLRVMSQDSPAERKSLFQMEMAELRTILVEATSKTLVLIDELCKGTEVQKGTCLLASALEKLDRLGCMGIVSTHLHGILDMQLDLHNLVYKAMETKETSGHLEPTWKMVDGKCRESLAFETALNEGVPEDIVHRALELYKGWFVQNAAASSLLRSVESESPPDAAPSSLELSSEAEETRSLEHVGDAVANVCRSTLGMKNPVCSLVGPRQQPPPFVSNHSCIYVLQRPDGKFYIGQTDNLAGRIASHRSAAALKQAPFLYLPVSNKSVACRLETALILRLAEMGFRLVNKVDQHHKHFGSSSSSTELDEVSAPF